MVCEQAVLKNIVFFKNVRSQTIHGNFPEVPGNFPGVSGSFPGTASRFPYFSSAFHTFLPRLGDWKEVTRPAGPGADPTAADGANGA